MLHVESVSRRFGEKVALTDVSFAVPPGEIHALLGPNGAGKTTLLRIVCGLLSPDQGTVVIDGVGDDPTARAYRQALAFVPSGDRSFYLRLSGFENLLFFARLHGLRKAEAVRRSDECLAAVGLTEARDRRVGLYSHGMQKRLAVARGLLSEPRVLVIDEATHDLDPEGARRVQALATTAAERGTSVVWATQRLDEIRGFANHVTVLSEGSVRFAGSVPQLLAMADATRFLVRLRQQGDAPVSLEDARRAVGRLGDVRPSPDVEHFVLVLAADVGLGDALVALERAGISLVACHEERSQLEEAFLSLTTAGAAS